MTTKKILIGVIIIITLGGAAAFVMFRSSVPDTAPDTAPTTAPPPPPSGQPGYHRISAEDAKKIMDENHAAIVLDVRTQEEYGERHIARSVLLPVADITARAPTVVPDKDAQILVYCRSGNRSRAAANLLVSMGYTNVYDFGGIETWRYGTVR